MRQNKSNLLANARRMLRYLTTHEEAARNPESVELNMELLHGMSHYYVRDLLERLLRAGFVHWSGRWYSVTPAGYKAMRGTRTDLLAPLLPPEGLDNGNGTGPLHL